MLTDPSKTVYNGKLAEWNLGAARGRHDDLAQGFEVLTEIAIIAQVDGIAFQAFDRSGKRHTAEGNFEYVLYVAQSQAIAGDCVAVNVELDVIAPHHALGKDTGGAGNFSDDCLDLFGDSFKLGQICTCNFDTHGCFNAGGKHVDARFNRHRPGVVQAGNLNGCVHRGNQLVGSAPTMGDDFSRVVLDVHLRPFLFGLEHDGRLDHINGAGSVALSARPILPKTWCTSGKVLMILSVT